MSARALAKHWLAVSPDAVFAVGELSVSPASAQPQLGDLQRRLIIRSPTSPSGGDSLIFPPGSDDSAAARRFFRYVGVQVAGGDAAGPGMFHVQLAGAEFYGALRVGC